MIVVISGYFNPIHNGHIEYIKEAKKLGDRLIVIVNNDYQQMLKKGKIIMNETDRTNIVSSLKYVDECILSIDQDKSVIKTLKSIVKKYGNVIFANGGDRTDSVPEEVVKDVKFVYGIGGEKTNSSSNLNNLLGHYQGSKIVEKPWGYELWIENNDLYCGKILHFNKGCRSSMHFHKIKDETFYVLSGKIRLEVSKKNIEMNIGDSKRLFPNTVHQFYALEDSDIIEVSSQHFDEDSIRIPDWKLFYENNGEYEKHNHKYQIEWKNCNFDEEAA
jgi:cytidyltransferase-like protein